MKKSLDNKEETTYRRAKERKTTENHSTRTGQLKNTVKREGSQVN
jgi:hypothetical protein